MKSCFTAIFLLFVYSLSAQKKTASYNDLSNDFSNGLLKYYHPNQDSLKAFCRIGCVFVKFGLNNKDRIDNLTFNKRSPVFITEALTKALDSLQMDVALMKRLRKLKKPVIMPLLYYYQLGCNFPKTDLSDNKVTGEQFYKKYLNTYLDLDHTAESLRFLLNFKNGNSFALDCVLFSPLVVGSGSIE